MATTIRAIRPGDKAPSISLIDQNGQLVRLDDYQGKKAVVLFFYPKAFTPGCTQESCQFRDQYEVFKDAGVEVIGISSDSPQQQAAFAKEHRLPYILLSDPGQQARKAFGVPKTLGLLPGRVTYVIDRNGIVQLAFNSQLKPEAHIQQALATLKRLG
ncbi:MAG: peroxiredoxin [Vampirovibrionales bacterium]|nr:peroxiredoxin [Vampirovibrionales bacterium]